MTQKTARMFLKILHLLNIRPGSGVPHYILFYKHKIPGGI